MAASLLLRGIDPLPTLRSATALELDVLGRAFKRANDLRQDEIELQAREIRLEIGDLVGVKKPRRSTPRA